MPQLSSQWGGLNHHLLATFWQVDNKGKSLSDIQVAAPITQGGGNLDIELQWQSPFENSGMESARPALMAMLQSGAMQPVMAALRIDGTDGKAQSGVTGNLATGFNSILDKASAMMSQAEGRTGITKLNSTQVFLGMTPLKFSISLLFRAWSNTYTEVEAPINQLIEWALPQQLSPDGMVLNAVQAIQGEGQWLDVLMPSVAPVMLAMHYKHKTYYPLVIESISDPLDSPITQDGNYASKLITLSLSTLTAWDKADWQKTRVRNERF